MTTAAGHDQHTVLITGGARRVGKLMADHTARLGHRVIVHYLSSGDDAAEVVRTINEKGGHAASIQADLNSAADVSDLIARASAAIGAPISALVNNASVFEHDTANTPNEDINQRAWRVNYLTPIQLAAQMAAAGKSLPDLVVVNMLDQKLWNMNPDFYSYTASKQALAVATVMLDQQRLNGVRACGIAPGIHLPSPYQSDAQFRAVAARNLLQRPIDPAEICRALGYILETRSFRGQTLHVDNGERFVPSARDASFVDDNLPL